MAHPVAYLELGSGDAAATSHFFGKLFDWPFHAMPNNGGYFEAGAINDEPGFGRFCNCTAPGGISFGLRAA